MSTPTYRAQRSQRLAEVERLSRQPHAELHAKLLDFVLGSLARLTDEEWMTLARKSPDRLIQSLAMSGRLAGYSEKNEVTVRGDFSHISDAELEEMAIANAQKRLDRLATLPAFRAVKRLTAEQRNEAVEVMLDGTSAGRARALAAPVDAS